MIAPLNFIHGACWRLRNKSRPHLTDQTQVLHATSGFNFIARKE